MKPKTWRRLKLGILMLSLLALLTWGVLNVLVLTNHLPGYVTPGAMGWLAASFFSL